MCNACSCGTTDAASNTTSVATAASEVAVFAVSGMTCGHCVSSVSGQIGQIDGVRAVDVDLASGAVTVTSDQPISRDAIRAAVNEAGYQLADT